MCACICVCTFAYVCMHVLLCMFACGTCVYVHVCTHGFTSMLYVDACAHWMEQGASQWRAVASFAEAVINSCAATGHLGLVLCLLVTTCP